MSDAIARIERAGVLPVIVIDEADRAAAVAGALLEGGIACAEVTMRTPAALAALEAMAGVAGFTVGAGTVLSPRQVEQCLGAGAGFLVSPGWDDEVIDAARGLGVPIVPGIATATEAQRAHRLGLGHVKVFPAAQLGGAAFVRAIAAPFPELRFLPSGGIDAVNAGSYRAMPEVFAVGGSWIADRRAILAGDLDGITARAREAAEAWARG